MLFSLCFHLGAQNAYYPLTKGNQWHYEGLDAWDRVTTEKDTLMANGTNYTLVNRTYSIVYQRQEGNRVYELINNKDQLLFDFSRSAKDTVAFYLSNSDTIYIVLERYDVVNYFGRQRRHWTFSVGSNRGVTDAGEWYEVIDSIGISATARACCSQSLVSASIDGKNYPPTSVSYSTTEIPEELSLAQNYPNPYNPQTQITFSLPCSGIPTLSVFDIAGRCVLTENLGLMVRGTHSIEFDGGNLSSGVYYYCLEFGATKISKRMTILK
jgi:hypothetical protein